MSNSDVENRSLGDELFELGWRQGTLFSAPSAHFSWNNLSDQDADYEAFQRPLIEIVAEWEKQNPDVFAAFNRVVNDIRVNLPESEEPPFDLRLILLVEYNGLSEEEANAINIFEDSVRARIDQNTVHLDPEMRILTEEEISMKEFYASRPIYLADYTYRGEEIEGAPPHGRN